MAAYKEITELAIVGDCLYNKLAKGVLNYDCTKLVLPYILVKVLTCTSEDSELITSRYNDLVRSCSRSESTIEQTILNTLLLEDGSDILLEDSSPILIE